MRLVLAMVALTACKDTPPERTARSEPERPIPIPHISPPVRVEALLAQARAKVAQGLIPSRIVIDYVRPDGLIDPAFGEVEVWFVSAGVDDPRRPTGAPIQAPDKRSDGCQILAWRGGVWSGLPCNPSSLIARTPVEPRCSVPVIWERAIAKGAPRDAVARMSLSASSVEPHWVFRIEDKVRKVDFKDAFADDCEPVLEAPEPTPGDDRPDAIDRTMIANTIGALKDEIHNCRGAKGTVRVHVTVAPDGSADVTKIEGSGSGWLDECLIKIIEGATFSTTRAGGTFSYPFVFSR